MFIRLLLCSAFLFGLSCTKKDNGAAKQKYLSYDSPIHYVYENLPDKTQAAMVQESPVSWSQLMSQDLALQELQSKYDGSTLAFAYAWAKEKAGTSSVKLSFFTREDGELEKLEEILTKFNVEKSDRVEVESVRAENADNIARIGDENLTWKQYISANISHAKLYRSLFRQRMQRLNGIVIRRYLLKASKAENLAMEAYVKKNIMSSELNPTEADVRDFAAKKGISETDLNEKMIERLKDIVRQNDRDSKIANYVAKNLVKDPVKVAFQGAQLTIKVPNLGSEIPQWGEKGPELIYIGHWDCQSCPESLKAFLNTQEKSAKVMKGFFIFSFPERDREARMGAEAGLCVDSIDRKSYWTFLSKILEIEETDIEKRINTAVEASGVNPDDFKDCFLKRRFQAAVNTHLSHAKAMGVTRSPLLIVEGRVLEPPFNATEWTQTLKDLNISQAGSGLWQKIKNFFGL